MSNLPRGFDHVLNEKEDLQWLLEQRQALLIVESKFLKQRAICEELYGKKRVEEALEKWRKLVAEKMPE